MELEGRNEGGHPAAEDVDARFQMRGGYPGFQGLARKLLRWVPQGVRRDGVGGAYIRNTPGLYGQCRLLSSSSTSFLGASRARSALNQGFALELTGGNILSGVLFFDVGRRKDGYHWIIAPLFEKG